MQPSSSEGAPQGQTDGEGGGSQLPPLDNYWVDPEAGRQTTNNLFRDRSVDHIQHIVDTLGGEISAALAEGPGQLFSTVATPGELPPHVSPPRPVNHPQPATEAATGSEAPAPTRDEQRTPDQPQRGRLQPGADQRQPGDARPQGDQPRGAGQPGQTGNGPQPAAAQPPRDRPRPRPHGEPRTDQPAGTSTDEKRSVVGDRPEQGQQQRGSEGQRPSASAGGPARPQTAPATEGRLQPGADQRQPGDARPQGDQPRGAGQPGQTGNGPQGGERQPAPEGQQGPVTADEVREYLAMLRRRAADPRLNIDDRRRANLDIAHQSLDYVLQQYIRAGHINADSSLEDVLAAVEAGVVHYGLEDRLRPGEFAELQQIVGIVEQRGQNPDDMRTRLARSRNAARPAPAGGQGAGTQQRHQPAQHPQEDSRAPQAQAPAGATQDRPRQSAGQQPAGSHSAREQAPARERRGNPRLNPEKLAQAVASVASENAMISTSAPMETTIRQRGGHEGPPPHTGHNTFGPRGSGVSNMPRHMSLPMGPKNPVYVQTPEGLKRADSVVEAVSFTYAQEPVYETRTAAQQPSRRGIFGLGRNNQPAAAPERVMTGSQPIMVANPSGQLERGVRFDYAFNPSLVGSEERQRELGLPDYPECDGPRSGNSLVVSTILPESVARQLHQQAREDPTSVRGVVEQIVFNAGGISPEVWEQGAAGRNGGRHSNRMKPPYEGLPPSHQIFMLEPYNNTETGTRGHIAKPL